MTQEVAKQPEKPTNLDIINKQIKELGLPDKLKAMQAFNKILDSPPKTAWIRKNNGVEYIPIRTIEDLLKSFFGAYQVEMVGEPKLIVNSIVVNVHLKVYHYLTGEWLVYAGTGAVPIQTQRGAGPNDVDKIIPTALHKNVPAALSFAVSNAAKKIGKVFGSGLNGDDGINQFSLLKDEDYNV